MREQCLLRLREVDGFGLDLYTVWDAGVLAAADGTGVVLGWRERGGAVRSEEVLIGRGIREDWTGVGQLWADTA
jgi:hypothetical protein